MEVIGPLLEGMQLHMDNEFIIYEGSWALNHLAREGTFSLTRFLCVAVSFSFAFFHFNNTGEQRP
jgi:hypothetical protein